MIYLKTLTNITCENIINKYNLPPLNGFFSYDVYGRVLWAVQEMTINGRTKHVTADYAYSKLTSRWLTDRPGLYLELLEYWFFVRKT